MRDIRSEGGHWGCWYMHDGSGCPTWIVGLFVHVRTTRPFSGSARGEMDGYGIAGVTLVESWLWTEESRMLPPWHPRWTASQPIDEFRVWLPCQEPTKELAAATKTEVAL